MIRLIAIAAGAAALLPPPAAAQPLSSADFNAVRGQYTLENGALLSVSGSRRHPVAELDDHAPAPLRALSPTLYVAVDGSLQLEFVAHANGVVPAVKLTMTRAAR
jgi:hypothetical protein